MVSNESVELIELLARMAGICNLTIDEYKMISKLIKALADDALATN